MSTKPITPSGVGKAKSASLPDVVIEVFNELIAQNFYGGSASVKQKDAVAMLVAKGLDRNEIFKKGWLDVEEVYRKAGWKVYYDKPGYNESYDAYFRFSKR
ncbi:MAG: hypothetical protein ACOZAO_02065 [Patescibacteria group bacterium]